MFKKRLPKYSFLSLTLLLVAACGEHVLRDGGFFYPCVRHYLAEATTSLEQLCAKLAADAIPSLEKLLMLGNRDDLFKYGKSLFGDCMNRAQKPK